MIQRCAVDSASHILYQAILCYKVQKYEQVLRLVQVSKGKISDSIFTTRPMNEAQYKQLGGDNLSIESVLRKHFLNAIEIEDDLCIPELYIELYGSNTRFVLVPVAIPLIICALFLQYLCQRRLGCQREADEALQELSFLVQHDDGKHIGDLEYGISWEILGICQQMNGDIWEACQSYLAALQKVDDVKRTVASCIRLGTILVKYF